MVNEILSTSSKQLNQEKDHNSNLSQISQVFEDNKSSDMERLLELTHEQLISELMKAHARIEALEAVPQQVTQCPIRKSNDGDSFAFREQLSDDSSQFFEDCLAVMDEQKTPIHDRDHSYQSGHARNQNPDDFIVAYHHKGTFPPCDCDQDMEEGSGLDNDDNIPHIIFANGVWENDLLLTEEDDESYQDEEFPLAPSPVLDTPPYEYIFLTKENEAKCRIFLNPKLNQVFQEELAKLQKQEGHQSTSSSEGGHNRQQNQDKNHEAAPKTDNVDWHNQNHLVNCSSTTLHEIKATLSGCNVIHCFDPSDVDLELKRIFTEKPPITHRIVRRKSRMERGSSVPAVDSYYGTCDLTKVGHASYFIPDLTKSERKAIGWKPDYHFGHWKYTTMTVPNIRINPIPFHPHPHVEDEHATSHSKHSHHHHPHHHHHHHHLQDTLLLQNPLHQKEINFSCSTLPEVEGSKSTGESPPSKNATLSCKNPIHQNPSNESFSYMTLSGEFTSSSQSCHLIRDKCDLKKILKWILPSCVKQAASSSVDSSFYVFSSEAELENEKDVSKRKGGREPRHEIETLVEATDKLAFPVSQTHISFAQMKPGQVLLDDNDNSSSHSHKPNMESSIPKNEKRHGEVKSHSHHHHHQHEDTTHRFREGHKHRSHHHGLFHWKQMLHPGTTNKRDGSMSVVGGDVLELESNTHALAPLPNEIVTTTKPILGLGNKSDLFKPLDDDSFTDECEEADDAVPGGRRLRRKQSKKLKPSKAYSRLLTLKDLGYQTEESDLEDSSHEENEEKVGLQNSRKTKEEDHEYVTASSSDLSSLANDYSTQIAKTYLNRKSQQGKTETAIRKYLTYGTGKKYRDRSGRLCKYDGSKDDNSSDTTTGDDGDDDISSCGSNCPLSVSPMSSSQQNSIATTHFNYDDGAPNIGYFNYTNSSQRGRTSFSGHNVETRFLDPKDQQLPKYQDRLPFTYNYSGESVPDMESNNLLNFPYVDIEDSVIEWVDRDFEEIEEGIGLLNSCLEAILSNRLDDDIVECSSSQQNGEDKKQIDEKSPDKVDGQHRIITLNELEEHEPTLEDMNQNVTAHAVNT